MQICETCNKENDGFFGSGRFCSRSCANKRVHSKETKEKISKGVKTSEKWLKNTPNLKNENGEFKSLEDKEKFLKSVKNAIETQKIKYKNFVLKEDFENLKYNTLKNRILFEQDSKCNKCGLKDWLGNDITLELEHKDGNNKNNLRENLECLCPNCHAQTNTWRGRNKRIKKIISDEEIVLEYGKYQNIRQTLLSLELAAKGSNYGRVKRALTLYGIKYNK